jgi:8-oxo-dGTP diphosphatase
MDFQRVDVVYALLFDENTNKILMVLNKNGTWSLPGGAVEAGETLRERHAQSDYLGCSNQQ